MYIRKTHDEIQIQGFYYGQWEVECNAEDLPDARRLIKEYRENCPMTSFKIKIVRVKNK